MAEKKSNSSVDLFNTAFAPITQKISLEGTGMKDTKIAG
jgi:hypothetical protein